jgi:hypothetical protein
VTPQLLAVGGQDARLAASAMVLRPNLAEPPALLE